MKASELAIQLMQAVEIGCDWEVLQPETMLPVTEVLCRMPSHEERKSGLQNHIIVHGP
jgi:endonuclease V-like protein UPF0215 family